ncbi:MAG TPA: SDR family NAD(P)-dependent oxidoreductase [Myxococcota bacterium]|jgi:short-subunit dehydrogenase|nr:SDR family NAD(P)-dependent oxidoreductase [Myxococcota bacterium]
MSDGDAALRARYGPWAVVAGAAEGLGAAWAEALADRGFALVLLDRKAAALDALASSLRARSAAELLALEVDLGRPDVHEVLQRTIGAREIGLLVYNAAVSPIGAFLEAPLERALETLDVNCRGLLALVHRLAPPMVARGRGGLVLTSSLSADAGAPRIATYAATKAFTLVFGESLWAELRERGVDVLTIRPGPVRTPGWQASQPAGADPSAPVPLVPKDVVTEALAALGGDDPSPIVGEANRNVAALMRQVPRRRLIELMSGVTARLRATPPR